MRIGPSETAIRAVLSSVIMVKLIVKFMSVARQRAGVGAAEFSSPGNSLRGVLKAIARTHRIEDLILLERGDVRPWA